MIPFDYATDGKLEWDRVQANNPLVKENITLKLETLIPNMLLHVIKTQ